MCLVEKGEDKREAYKLYKKEWNKINVDKISSYNRGYYNKKNREYLLSKVFCRVCRKDICKASFGKHLKSKKHNQRKKLTLDMV